MHEPKSEELANRPAGTPAGTRPRRLAAPDLPASAGGGDPREPAEVPGETPEELPPGAPSELPPDLPPEMPPCQALAGGLTVLLVEDDSLIRQSTADMLDELGHRVLEARRAAEALEALETQAVDLLMTDVGLPDGSGVELARRGRLVRPALLVVFATGHSRIEGLAEAGLADSSLLLEKPFEEEALGACLRRAAAGVRGG
ncbi:Response regulator receiver domain-containing protein [Tistlia consotensis]|uniref:Response regulator receiver domain-containing protein n=1 Tax=Tistlia consotensis USBA 355 TaxID=560819 RepID=A0A1Y6BIF7_9PROT|nr:response regulator [Tistlia consotensis]SMF04773.1 Response regulator receiver domain-containing protein [Tistlia consotensis USBA 355]SNR54780.1 Response regulator receiver domain-containing protein [Tistlia consotensis]